MSVVNLLVEGDLDEAAGLRLIVASGHEPGACYGKRGCQYIREKVPKFNLSASSVHYLALVDFMDTKLSCPPQVVAQWLPHRRRQMLFRVVVRELESWLLADRINIAAFLSVHRHQIPLRPELLQDPKRTLVNLARRSRSKSIRTGIVPDDGATAQVGRLYNSEIKRFISEHWDVNAARSAAPSLDGCMKRLEEL